MATASHPPRQPPPPRPPPPQQQQQQKQELQIPFPFQPYPAQKALMQQLYQTLDTGHVGLFESPTGTGKSLSLICAGLYWLKERQRKDDSGEDDPVAASSSSSSTSSTTTTTTAKAAAAEPDWLRDYGKDKERAAATEKRDKVRERRQALHLRLEEARQASHRLSALRPEGRPGGNDDARAQHNKKRSGSGGGAKADAKDTEEKKDEEDEDLLPAEYESGKESDRDDDDTSAGFKGKDEKEEEEGEELDRSAIKILYCSRTHSQVSQFVMEIQKTAFQDNIRVISLSSRKNLCINDDVLKLGSDGRISDRCLDMQKGKAKEPAAVILATSSGAGLSDAAGATSKKRPRAPTVKKQTTKCPFLPSDGAKQQTLYRDHALSQVRNLEDLAELGKKLGTCSYYGTRRAVAQAEVICMPYATLLHKGTRESMKIPLKGNVVLVDEAHNLVEAINAVHTSQLSLQAMSRALSQVTLYWERYNTRLSGKNAVYVQQVIRVLKGLVEFVRTKASAAGAASGATAATAEDEAVSTIIMSVNELVFEADMDNMNLFKLVRYMEQSQIAKKVLGFADRRLGEVQIHGSEAGSSSSSSATTTAGATGAAGGPEDADESAEYVSSHVSSLQFVQSFLATLTGSSQDGRIVLETGHGPQKGRRRPAAGLKYIMLNAAVHFREVVAEARSVVLVGGTMQPVAPIVAQLFPDLPASRLDVFSCGHVIPPENLTALCMSKGPTGVGFDFTHKSRVLPEQMDELGRLLLNVCTVTPGGVVVFLPSYGYEEVVMRRWRETGLLPKLQAKKAIFTEPKRAKDVDAVLQAYSAAIASSGGSSKSNSAGGGGGGGAILFCVVGAKMSEGINFSDDMARCVVMVGLPYPDRRDPELQQKLQYLDNLQSSRGSAQGGGSGSGGGGGGASALGPVSGKSYYQNLCMRAVNQSIGRAIRHANDWAAIVLVDRRYFTDPSILPLLPKWIADRVVPYQQSLDFGRAFVHLSQFFRGKAKGSGASG